VTAHAYVQWSDVPQQLVDSSRQHVDVTGAQIVAFDDCPLCGEIEAIGARIQIEFSFPRTLELRNALIDWLVHWGIPFAVVP
jgi:hypothetical protein